MTSPAEIDLHEQACSQLDTLYRHLRDGSAPGPTDLVTVLVAQRLLEDRLAGLRADPLAKIAAPFEFPPPAPHSCRPDGVLVDGEVYTCPTCQRQWTFERETHGWRAAEPAVPSHPVDRHIARAAKATAPRRSRAPSAGAPCATGSPRHRFGADGGCKVTGCAVKRALAKGAQLPEAEPEPAAIHIAGRLAADVGVHLADGIAACGREIGPLEMVAANHTRLADVTCPACHERVPLDEAMPSPPPPAKARPPKRRGLTIEMPDGSKLHPGDEDPA